MNQRLPLMIALASSVGCTAAPQDAGFETGPCLQGECFDGLACWSELRVARSDTDGANDSRGPSNDGGSGGGGGVSGVDGDGDGGEGAGDGDTGAEDGADDTGAEGGDAEGGDADGGDADGGDGGDADSDWGCA